MPRTIITVADFEHAGASIAQCALFKRIFPNGIPNEYDKALTLILKNASDFDWYWAGFHLLNNNQRIKFKKADLAARIAYDSKEQIAWIECKKASPAFNPTALAKYKKTMKHEWAKLEKASATAFINALFEKDQA